MVLPTTKKGSLNHLLLRTREKIKVRNRYLIYLNITKKKLIKKYLETQRWKVKKNHSLLGVTPRVCKKYTRRININFKFSLEERKDRGHGDGVGTSRGWIPESGDL